MLLPDADRGFQVDHRLVHDPVVDPVQPVVEPPVECGDPLGTPEVERLDVTDAADPQLPWDVALPERLPELAEVVGPHVLVLDAMHQEDAGLDGRRVVQVVALGPERRVVAVLVAVVGRDLVPHRRTPGLTCGIVVGDGSR